MTENNHISFIEVIEILVRRRRTLITTVLLVLALSAVVSLLIPRTYESTASILPPDAAMNQLDVAGILQSVGIIQPARLPTMATPADLYKAILESQNVRIAVIDSLDLEEVYGAKNLQAALETLAENSDIRVTDEGLIRVAVEDRSAERAAAIANAHVFELDRFNKDSSSERARRTRRFVEGRLTETEGALGRAENGLLGFQESTGIVTLPEQAVVSIETAAELWKSMTELEVTLAATAGFESERSPRVVRLRSQIRELRSRIAELDRGMGDGGGDSAGSVGGTVPPRIFVGLREAPDLALRYARFLRDVEIQKAVFTFLTRQLEEAKIQENRDTPTLQVLDRAVPPSMAARPKKKVIVASATAIALLFSALWCLWIERWERLGDDSEEVARWREVRSHLRGDIARLRGTPRSPEKDG